MQKTNPFQHTFYREKKNEKLPKKKVKFELQFKQQKLNDSADSAKNIITVNVSYRKTMDFAHEIDKKASLAKCNFHFN